MLARAAISILPRGATEVAASNMYGKGSSVGAATAIGLVPSMGLTPKVGAWDGCALVTLSPTWPSCTAIMG